MSPDELTMYFAGAGGALSDSATQYHLFVATRTKPTDSFGAPKPLAIDSAFNDYDPSVSSDGLTLFYGYNNFVETRVWFATRSSTLADFSSPAALAGVASATATDDEGAPFITADGQELWFYSNRSGSQGSHDIYMAPKSGSTFANPVVQSTLSSPSDENVTMLSADRLAIYIASNRPGGLGSVDIWRAMRVSAQDAFPAPVAVTELNSTGIDYPGWLSPDNCRLYMASTRKGTLDIYVAERAP